MSKRWLWLLGLAALGLACGSIRGRGENEFLVGGIQIREPDLTEWAGSLAAHGLNTVAVTVYARQGLWNSDDLEFDEIDDGVVSEIRAAKAQGLRVALVMRVWLDPELEGNRFLWHGMIMPGTERLLSSWFARYTHFLTAWAKIAEEEGIDVFAIGSELNALASTRPVEAIPVLEEYYRNPASQALYKADLLGLARDQTRLDAEAKHYPTLEAFADAKVAVYETWASKMTADAPWIEETGRVADSAIPWINDRRQVLEERWESTLERVREVYSGRLTYAANFDQYTAVGFWHHLDMIGINAYFPLHQRFLADEERSELEPLLEAGWRQVFEDIVAFQRTQRLEELPVIFTELGYTERRDSTLAPWAGHDYSIVWGEEPVADDPAPAASGDESPLAERRLFVWADQPLDPNERVLAMQALRRVTRQDFPGILQGILYWKLSTKPEHRDIEPFVAILGPESTHQPLIQELAAFCRSSSRTER